MSLSDWAVLAALAEEPAHGFRLGALFAKGGELGVIWTIQRPQVYRALEHLGTRAFAKAISTEPGDSGPPRIRYAVTPEGQKAVSRWLYTPVTHLRDARGELLLKLIFLERCKENPELLLRAQLERFQNIQQDYQARLETAESTERLALEWRLEMAQAALHFLRRRCGPDSNALRLVK